MQQSNQSRIMLLVTMVVAIVFISIVVWNVIDSLFHSSIEMKQQETTNIVIMTSDKVIDQSWGSLAYKGQIEIKEHFPVHVSLFSEINTDALIKKTIIQTVEEGAEVIIGHGREFSDVFTELAPNYSSVHFVTIHGTSKYPNQSVYTFYPGGHGQIEYFAALPASLKTETNKVGLLDVLEDSEKNPHFKRGLSYFNPGIKFYYQVAESRNDGDEAVKLMKKLIKEGVDVVYSKGNEFNREVIELAKKHNIYVIGYLDDQSYLAEDLVLTSVINDVPQAYVAIMKDYFSEPGITPGTNFLTKDDGVYRLAPLGPMFTEKEKKYIEYEIDKINRK
ncbi:BMP family ABC transporter substrate-binding protein [Halalkalibacter kiskunsagensis]|uniref:BMP family ABC transporter substrate-binding protein n=1 Tax=Halalkalibacter kiskunsagensis TaxID=1548599 RepID=A0ABV6KGK9_9BACI